MICDIFRLYKNTNLHAYGTRQFLIVIAGDPSIALLNWIILYLPTLYHIIKIGNFHEIRVLMLHFSLTQIKIYMLSIVKGNYYYILNSYHKVTLNFKNCDMFF